MRVNRMIVMMKSKLSNYLCQLTTCSVHLQALLQQIQAKSAKSQKAKRVKMDAIKEDAFSKIDVVMEKAVKKAMATRCVPLLAFRGSFLQ